MNKTEILQTLRSTLRHKVTEDGIYLVFKSRYKESVERVAKMVRDLGGHVESIEKSGKTVYKNHSTNLTWAVVFTVSVDEDLYLAGRINLNRFHELTHGGV